MGARVPVFDADGKIDVMDWSGRSTAMSITVVNKASVPDGHRSACAKVPMPNTEAAAL